jgi:serine/threonine protein kinase
VLAAIKYLLSKNIYHRDIKLENILMHEGKVKLADFGASRMFNKDDSVTVRISLFSLYNMEIID